MSWIKVGDETASTGAVFATFRCDCCPRKMTTCGSPPATPCVCSPGPRHGSANKGRRR